MSIVACKVDFFEAFILHKWTQWQCTLRFDNSTAIYVHIKTLKPYALAGFEPGIFCSVGGRDNHYATLPGKVAFVHMYVLCEQI
jgi:hypothetical protein